MGNVCCSERDNKAKSGAAGVFTGRETTVAERGFEEGWYRASAMPGAPGQKGAGAQKKHAPVPERTYKTTAAERGFESGWYRESNMGGQV
ncbi:unnamed protein product [Amoebophrya sp. A25]|nr:unnamed protein product [Amoebophrya sp. A25]|eukprot:GSA25T00003142001.1